jgi:hypothetical protein
MYLLGLARSFCDICDVREQSFDQGMIVRVF